MGAVLCLYIMPSVYRRCGAEEVDFLGILEKIYLLNNSFLYLRHIKALKGIVNLLKIYSILVLLDARAHAD